MRFPISLTVTLSRYLLRQRRLGTERFPLVLMLEPTHACNLTCQGCGRIREYRETLGQRMSVDECLQAADECGAPVVTVSGGEPLTYPGVAELVAELIRRRRHVYLCTNGVLLAEKLPLFHPSSRLIINVHLDGLERTHDALVERQGVFAQAVEGIRLAKFRGFLVTTNTTVYSQTDMNEVEALYEFVRPLGVNGHMLSPGYSYQAVEDELLFLSREEVHRKFSGIQALAKRFPLVDSPIYLDFLQGKRDLPCTAWGNPTRNPVGWKSPCYLITDAHYPTYREFIESTPWERYGRGQDPRCQHCMVHSGYEASAALGVNKQPGDSLRMFLWQFG